MNHEQIACKRILPHKDLLSSAKSLRAILSNISQKSGLPILGFSLYGSAVSGRKENLTIGDIDVLAHVDLQKLYGSIEPYASIFDSNRISFEDEEKKSEIRELRKIIHRLGKEFQQQSGGYRLQLIRNSVFLHLQNTYTDSLSPKLHFALALSGEKVLDVAVAKLENIYTCVSGVKCHQEVVRDNFYKLTALHPIYTLFHISVGQANGIRRLRRHVFHRLDMINRENIRKFVWGDIMYMLFAIEQGYKYTDGKVKIEPQILDFTFPHVRSIYRGFQKDALCSRLAGDIEFAKSFFTGKT